jgi:S-adenosylmethionine hydrolase
MEWKSFSKLYNRINRGGDVALISLMTDFGLTDGFVGVMKGVIWGITPQARIADLTHLVPPQDIRAAALILNRSAPYFPDGTIHVVVVDPGVGTARRPIAARLGSQYFVGPDNGVFTLVLERAERQGALVEIIHLDKPQYWLAEVSNVFHGRDIFSPVAAALANGIPLAALGSPLSDPVCLSIPQPRLTPTGLQGEITHIDHFGNIIANIRHEHLSGVDDLTVRLYGEEIHGMVRAFGDRSPGELIALIGSTGDLVVAVVNGDATRQLDARIGDPVEIIFPNKSG